MSEQEDYEDELRAIRESRKTLESFSYQEDEAHEEQGHTTFTMQPQVNAPASIIAELDQASLSMNQALENSIYNISKGPHPSRKLVDLKSEYQLRGMKRVLSPERQDVYDKTITDSTISEKTSYKNALKGVELERAKKEVERKIDILRNDNDASQPKIRRWDADGTVQPTSDSADEWSDDIKSTSAAKKESDSTPMRKLRRWDATPAVSTEWDATPSRSEGTSLNATPSQTSKRSRWDATPVNIQQIGATPMRTPSANYQLATPGSLSAYESLTPEQKIMVKHEREIEERNRPWTDYDLDSILPSEGFVTLEAPPTYVPLRTPSKKMMATPMTNLLIPGMTPAGISLPGESASNELLSLLKPEDYPYFSKLIQRTDLLQVSESDSSSLPDITLEEAKELKVMRLLLKIKNGTPPMRRSALRQLTAQARDFGPKLLFDKLLPLFMSQSLEEQERHLLVKVIDRILYQLEDAVRPYVHNLLVVLEPLLIDEDYTTRQEGKELISHLAKAAGLASMLAAMRPDLEHSDEYVRNTTARALAVVASALGIPMLLPFLKAVTASKRTWEARHTGVKIIQHIAILQGPAILPHLAALISCLEKPLNDDHHKVRTMTALALAAMAEASNPFGFDAFELVLRPLWSGVSQHRGKALAAFLKAVGSVLPLMNHSGSPEHSAIYARELLTVLKREFQTQDDDLKKIVLHTLDAVLITTDITSTDFMELLPEFMSAYWTRRTALDRRIAKQLIITTLNIAKKLGLPTLLGQLIPLAKDESEAFRRMVIEAIDGCTRELGFLGVETALEESLIDALLYTFQEQSSVLEAAASLNHYQLLHEENIILNAFGRVLNSLGHRAQPYLKQVCSTLLWRLNHKSARVRQQAAELLARIASTLSLCQQDALLAKLSLILYESLGEEYPDVLSSLVTALHAVLLVLGPVKIQPSARDLLPRITPILKNRHERVQESCVLIVGTLADLTRDSTQPDAVNVSPREWMRICFELLELLKAHQKFIRRAAIETFGKIAKTIGPQDVLVALLNNLKVQERQLRVCTTLAIAIVADSCGPFTVLPALMNEYRVPELNVQNGVLKSLSFLSQYIGEASRDYIYSMIPLLIDALIDRDLVHRQIAATAIMHLALGVAYSGAEDGLIHLFNHLFPNILETSPHLIKAFLDALVSLRVSLGAGFIYRYLLQGLFHPARRIRSIYWKAYNNLYINAQDALVPHYPDMSYLGSNYAMNEISILL